MNINSHLENIIFDSKSIIELINKNFIEQKFSYEEQILANDFSLHKKNREPINGTTFFFFNETIVNIYALSLEMERFALLFSCNLSQATFDKLIQTIGMPENSENILNLSIDSNYMWFWEIKNIQIMISKRSYGPLQNRWTIDISNIPLNERLG